MDKRRPSIDVQEGDWILTRDEGYDCSGDPILDMVVDVEPVLKLVETWHGETIPFSRIEEVRRAPKLPKSGGGR
jgi:hypothetical protein